jgi:hypothetical protein
LGKRKNQESIGLVPAALEDQSIRQHFFTLLAPSRLNQLQKWGIELEQEHASQPPITSIALLKDTDIASRTPYILNKNMIYFNILPFTIKVVC